MGQILHKVRHDDAHGLSSNTALPLDDCLYALQPTIAHLSPPDAFVIASLSSTS